MIESLLTFGIAQMTLLVFVAFIKAAGFIQCKYDEYKRKQLNHE